MDARLKVKIAISLAIIGLIISVLYSLSYSLLLRFLNLNEYIWTSSATSTTANVIWTLSWLIFATVLLYESRMKRIIIITLSAAIVLEIIGGAVYIYLVNVGYYENMTEWWIYTITSYGLAIGRPLSYLALAAMLYQIFKERNASIADW